MTRPFVNCPDCVEIAHRYNIYGEPAANVIWGEAKIPPITHAQIDFLAQALHFWANSFLKPLFANDIQYVSTNVREMSAPGGYEKNEASFPWYGIQPDVGMPANCGIRFELQTGIDGRAYRGWNVLPPPPRNKVSQNLVDATWIAALRSAWANQTIQLDARGFRWSIVSRYIGQTPRAAPIITRVTAITYVNNTVDSMRKRLP